MRKIFSTALVAFLIVMSTAVSAQSITTRDKAAEEIVRLVNIEREKAGLPSVKLSRELYRPAMIRAREIVKSFSHTRPNGQPFNTVFIAYGITYRTVGENLAAGQTSCEMVMQQWMDSPSHRANILNKNFKYLGVAYLYSGKGKYKHYWVQEFKG